MKKKDFSHYMYICVQKSCSNFCDPMDCSPPGSSVHGILQARILEWVAMPSSRESSCPGIEPTSLLSPVLAGGFFTTKCHLESPCVCVCVCINMCYVYKYFYISVKHVEENYPSYCALRYE